MHPDSQRLDTSPASPSVPPPLFPTAPLLSAKRRCSRCAAPPSSEGGDLTFRLAASTSSISLEDAAPVLAHPASWSCRRHRSSTLNTGDATTGHWLSNDQARIITHAAHSSSPCSKWALHYASSVAIDDISLRETTDQRNETICAPLAAEVATL